MLLAALVTLALVLAGAAREPARRAPAFTAEPPARVPFAAASGARVPCGARGEPPPRLAWVDERGAPLPDLPGVRRVHGNGTLEVFPSHANRDGPAPSTVRCRAANAHGAIESRDVLLQPVADTNWEVTMLGAAVPVGGVAALACRVEPADQRDATVEPPDATVAPRAAPALFYREDRVLHVDAPSPAARYLAAGGALLVRGAAPADAGRYGCSARHPLTARSQRSPPAHLVVLPSSPPSAPRLTLPPRDVHVSTGVTFCLPCVSAGSPPPQYTWYRERGGRLQPVLAADTPGTAWLWAGGAALCVQRATPDTEGAWLCKASNGLGDATAQARVRVLEALVVRVEPQVMVAAAGSTVQFNCSASEPAAVLRWTRDGAALPGAMGPTLVLRGVSRALAGVYQCRARSEQASAELRLADAPPELQDTFIEQALRPGATVALRCAATAAPPPHLAWLLDGLPLDHYLAHHRYSITEETPAPGELVSTLRLPAADGGRYSCRATNALGAAEHSARLNIYGPPTIRPMSTVRAVAGEDLTLHCPYAGYPISSVSWRRRGVAAALGGVGRAAVRGGALLLRPALPHDAGHYACSAGAPAGPAASGDVEIQVRIPPKISPFIFSSELTEGSSVQVLCGVSSGDKPVYFSWLKDRSPLPPNLQIEEKSLSEFSLLVFPALGARHSGAYTCRAANHAASVNYTAVLSVRVPPSWVSEPLDAAVLLGGPLQLECAARGQPAPAVTWHRKIGDGTSGGEQSERWEAASPGWAGQQGAAGEQSAGTSRSALGVRAAPRSLQGVYRCTADNGVGAPLVKHVNVTVHEPAHFGSSAETTRNVSAVRGGTVALACLALGDPPLAVHWAHGGRRLDTDSDRWAVAEARRAGGVRSTLTLRAADRRDAGQYRCHARNQYGRSEALMFLTVEEPPPAPLAPRLSGLSSRWVRLRWRAPRASGVRFTAQCSALNARLADGPAVLHYNLSVDAAADVKPGAEGGGAGGGAVHGARLDGLRPAAAYSLRLLASNHVGQSPPSDAVLFITLEEAPGDSPQNVRVRPLDDGELHVSWTPPAQESWHGEVLGYAVSWRELAACELGALGPREAGARAGTAVARGWAAAGLTLRALRPFARYELAARAFTRAGAGPPSAPAYAATSEGVPAEPPQAVSCEPAAARALRVRWAPAAGSGGAPVTGYDVQYALEHGWHGAGGAVRAAPGGAALLRGLLAAANYSVWVRARSERGAGPPSAPALCRTDDDVPGTPEPVGALPAGRGAVRVTWAPPAERGGRLTHYTLHTRELGKVGGEWSQRVPADGEPGVELWHEVRGLRDHAAFEFWVRAATAAGVGPPSHAVSAAPAAPQAARVTSLGRELRAAAGARLRLRCSALGAPPLTRRWSPLPPAHSITDDGDLIIHKVEHAANYTCVVRNAAGADAVTYAVRALRPPAPPALRLTRAEEHALHLAWEQPADGGAPVLGYTVHWWAGWAGSAGEADAHSWRAGDAARGATLGGLACGAPYRVTLRAHNAAGASVRSPPLALRTRGDKARAPAGRECIWANSTALRVALLAWGGRCAVQRFSLALRRAGGTWAELRAHGDSAEAAALQPGTWYELRVVAHAPAGDSRALYRAPTLTADGEPIGEPIELPSEAHATSTDGADGAGDAAGGRAWWRGSAGAAGALFGALAALLAAALLARRVLLASSPRAARATHAHPMYVAEPNGKTLTPPDGELRDISPYATFSMAGGARACALHLRSFAPAPLALAAPHRAEPYRTGHGSARDSDSESSGSPCAACAAERRAPPEPLPVGESSTGDGSYGARRREPRPPSARYLAAPLRDAPHRTAPRRAVPVHELSSMTCI